MIFSTELVLTGLVVGIVLTLMLWFKKTTKSFSVDLPHGKDILYDFLKTPSCLPQIHPSVEAVENMREEEGKFYFEVVENLGTMAGKKRVSMSLESYLDLSTHRSYIRLENHDALVKVCITLILSDYNPLAKVWSAHLTSPSEHSHPPEPVPRTPPPSPASSEDRTPRSTVQVCIEVGLVGGLVQLIARHLVHVWKTSLSNTDTLLACKTES